MEITTSTPDIIFYCTAIFAILYWLFTTSKEEKFRDIRNQIKTLNNIVDDVEKITKQQEQNTSKKNEEESSKENKAKTKK